MAKNPGKKIIYVCRRFNANLWGGTESVIMNSARQLTDKGFQVEIFTTLALSNVHEEFIEGIRVRRFPFSLPWFGLSEKAKESLLRKGGNLLSLSLLWALIREPDVFLIHVHSTHRIGAIGRTAARFRKIPYVVSLHGGWFNLPVHQKDHMLMPTQGKIEWGKILGFLLGSRKVLQDASAIICVGEDEYQQTQSAFPDKRVVYMPNGVRLDMFSESFEQNFRDHYQLSAQDRIMLCVSRIDYQKNQRLLVETMPAFLKKVPDLKLVLIGSISVPKYAEELKQLIRESDIEDRVIVIPGLSPKDKDLIGAYQSAEVFVLPTLHEPFGIVILEAWAARKPVLASGLGGILGFTETGRDCLHFDPTDQKDFQEKVFSVLADKELSKRLAAEGFKKAKERYDWSIIVQQLKTLYNEVSVSMKGKK